MNRRDPVTGSILDVRPRMGWESGFRALIENLEEFVFVKDGQLRYVAVNPRYCQALGRTNAEITGKTDSDLYPPHVAAKHQAEDRLVLRDGRRFECEEQNLITGQPRTVRTVKTPIKDRKGHIVGVLGIASDVTEQRQLETKLRQVQKMETVGQLAGGVAHDFNNLLTVILGNVSLLRARRMQEEADQELLGAMEMAALQAAELTGKLLGFAQSDGATVRRNGS